MNNLNIINGLSLISTAVNIPLEFGVTKLSTEIENSLKYNVDYNILQDENGLNSIIELVIPPYIDFSYYDNDRRMFFTVDKWGNKWREYNRGDYVIEDNSNISLSGRTSKIYYSIDNVLKNVKDYLRIGEFSTDGPLINELSFTKYKPITVKVGTEELTDITDYSFNNQPTLNFINTTKNKAFYFKENKIYTNLELLGYNINDIDITYYSTVNSVNVTCLMSTNTAGYSNYTPIVDFFMLKLTGQTL